MAYKQVHGSDWMNQINNNFALLEGAALIELASDAETITGKNTAKGVTPAGLAAKLAAGLANNAETITGESTTKSVTPAGLAAKLDAFVKAGTHAVTGGEATEGTLDIATGLAGATVFIVQVYRAGVMVLEDAAVSIAAGVLTIANGAETYAVTEDDIVNWIVF